MGLVLARIDQRLVHGIVVTPEFDTLQKSKGS